MPLSRRWLWRIGAGVWLVCVLAVLYWGAFGQDTRRYPFYAPDLPTWFLEKYPHPGHGTMPVVPAGSLGGFVPRGLCATAEPACGGLEIADDGRALLPLEGRPIQALARVRYTRTSEHAFAVSVLGEVWQLTKGALPIWQHVELPGSVSAYSKADQNDATFAGNEGAVWSVGFSPQGDRIVSGGVDGTVRLWQLDGTPAAAPFKGHEGSVLSVAFSPQGDRIVSGGEDGTVRLWQLDGTPAAAPFKGHEGPVVSVAFSPQGDRIVSGGDDGTVRLWQLDGTPAATPFKGHEGPVSSVAFSPQGDRIVSGGEDGTVRLWRLDGTPAAAPFKGHEGWVGSVAVSPQGDRIVSGGGDGTVRLWQLDGTPAAAPFKGHEGGVRSVAFSPQGDRIVSGGDDGTVRLWQLDGTPAAAPFKGHEGWVGSVAFSPQGDRIVSGGQDGTVRLWQLDGMPAAGTEGLPIVTDVAFDAAQTLWVVGRHGYAAVRDTSGLQRVTTKIGDDFLGVASLSDGRAVAVGASGVVVRFKRAQISGAADNGSGTQQAPNQAPQQAAPQPAVADSLHIQEAGERTLRAVFFADETHGWVAGDDGLLLYTGNGGSEPWTVLHEGGSYRLTDVYVQGGALGWAAGETPDGHRVVLASDHPSDAQSWQELPHYIAPWWFFLGVPGFILAGFFNVWAWRLEPPPPEESITGAGTSDRPLTWRDPDARVLRPLARGLSRFLRNVNTEPPLTIAITGRWGSGKSSLMNSAAGGPQAFRRTPGLVQCVAPPRGGAPPGGAVRSRAASWTARLVARSRPRFPAPATLAAQPGSPDQPVLPAAVCRDRGGHRAPVAAMAGRAADGGSA